MVAQPDPADIAKGTLTASTRILGLAPGVYRFSVAAGSPTDVDKSGNLILPAVYLALAPDTSPKAINLMPGPSANGTWLCGPDDLVFAGVADGTAKLLMTSIPGAGGEELDIAIERVDGQLESKAGPAVAGSPRDRAATTAMPAAAPQPLPSPDGLRLRIVAHIRNRGELTFVDVPWAGRVGKGMWIEGFAITPLEGIVPADIEYRGLTASGFETPWVSGGQACGTYGKADPLVAFAARLKPRAAGPGYDCEYGGYFRSGALVESVSDGALCRSTLKNDPLEGIRVRIAERQSPAPNKATAARGAGKRA